MITLDDICAEIHNYFVTDKKFGVFTISGGSISPLDFLAEGQYFRIVGSVFNDGVYKNTPEGIEGLTDEEFDGAIWAMAVPKQLIDLMGEMNTWQAKYGEVVASPYTSESFGGYSYTKSSGMSADDDSSGIDWRKVFKSSLNRYRKLRVLP